MAFTLLHDSRFPKVLMPKLWNWRAPRNCSRVTRYGDTLAAARILYNCQDSSNVTDYYISFLIRGQSINAQTYFCGYFVKYYSGQNTMQIPSSHFNCWWLRCGIVRGYNSTPRCLCFLRLLGFWLLRQEAGPCAAFMKLALTLMKPAPWPVWLMVNMQSIIHCHQ